MRTMRSIGAVVVATCIGAAAPAAAFDLGGTWAGKISCQGVFNGASQSLTLTPTLLIDGSSSFDLAVDGVHYTAVPYPAAGKPDKGEIAVVQCGTSATVSGGEFGGEFGRMKVATNPVKGTGSLSGTSFRASELFAASLYTCRWSFKRVSAAPVAVGGCTSQPQ